MAPDFILNSRVNQRMSEIERQLPDILDQMTVSVEAGLGFDAAMARVCQEDEGALVDELNRALQDVQLGMPRIEALKGHPRADQRPDLKHFILTLGQAERLGMPLAKVLRIQAREMRQKRRQRAEEAALKTPVKLVFPLVLCIMPALFVVILGLRPCASPTAGSSDDRDLAPRHRRLEQPTRRATPRRCSTILKFESSHGPQLGRLPTGYHPLDTFLGGGFAPQDLVVVGGKPGTGKTVAMMQWARTIARAGKTAAMVSYDHGERSMLSRLLSLELGEAAGDVDLTTMEHLRRAIKDHLAGACTAEKLVAFHPALRRAYEAVESYGPNLYLFRGSAIETDIAALRTMAQEVVGPGGAPCSSTSSRRSRPRRRGVGAGDDRGQLAEGDGHRVRHRGDRRRLGERERPLAAPGAALPPELELGGGARGRPVVVAQRQVDSPCRRSTSPTTSPSTSRPATRSSSPSRRTGTVPHRSPSSSRSSSRTSASIPRVGS